MSRLTVSRRPKDVRLFGHIGAKKPWPDLSSQWSTEVGLLKIEETLRSQANLFGNDGALYVGRLKCFYINSKYCSPTVKFKSGECTRKYCRMICYSMHLHQCLNNGSPAVSTEQRPKTQSTHRRLLEVD